MPSAAQQPLRPAWLASFIALWYASILGICRGAELHWAGLQLDSGYDHEGQVWAAIPGWMGKLRGETRFSDLSIPGTHDTCTYKFITGGLLGDYIVTQALSLLAQLQVGVRALDIRVRHLSNAFVIHHGPFFLDLNFDDVMSTVVAFLSANPTEAVILRLKEDFEPFNNTRTLDATLAAYIHQYRQWLYVRRSDNPTLDSVRGRIVILQELGTPRKDVIQYSTLVVQDSWHCLNRDWLYVKWLLVKQQLRRAAADRRSWTINYLSASGAQCPPWFIASGKAAASTNSTYRLTTRTTCPTCGDPFPDFPRVECEKPGWCKIAYAGTNLLTTKYLLDTRAAGLGIIMSDFPGSGLIAAIIAQNAPAESNGVRVASATAAAGCITVAFAAIPLQQQPSASQDIAHATSAPRPVTPFVRLGSMIWQTVDSLVARSAARKYLRGCFSL